MGNAWSAGLWLLRAMDRVFPPLAGGHKSNAEQTTYEVAKAASSMGRYLQEAGDSAISVLDFGCGWGGETLWLADKVSRVVGVDVDAENIQQAERARVRHGASNCQFVLARDGRIPCEDATFDAAFSTDTFEHVMNLDVAFGELYRVLKPGGRVLTRFGPLFYSPLGYHLRWACQVPYAHLLFGIETIMVLRNERRRFGDAMSVASWVDTGLNMRRFDEFHRAAVEAGFELKRFLAIPVAGQRWLTRLPVAKDLFIFGIDAHLVKPAR